MGSIDISYSDVVLAVTEDKFDRNQKVIILLLLANELNIQTISEMARLKNKTPSGVRGSGRFRKIEIGTQLMCIDQQSQPK